MITQNMTPGNDNQLIWLLQITLDTITYYFTNWHTDITLSGNVYKHGVIESNTLSVTGRELSFSGNKYIGSIGALSFNLSKRSGFSLDDIQPTANKPYTSNRTVSLGYIWQGATLESEITFQDMYFIQEIKGDPNRLSFSCIDKCELDFINIPFYTVQKDYDNGISYFPNAPDQSFGQPIPILYGHFNDVKPDIGYFKLAPTVCVHKRLAEFKVCSHSCYAIATTEAQSVLGQTYSGYGINHSTGQMVADARYISSDYIDVSQLQTVLFSGKIAVPGETNHPFGIAGYNENKTYITAILSEGGQYSRYTLNIPSGVKYIRTSAMNDAPMKVENTLSALDTFGNMADAFRYLEEANTYLYLISDYTSKINTLGGHKIGLLSSPGFVRGTIYLQLKKAGAHSATSDIEYPTIDNQITYSPLTNQTYGGANQLSWQLDTTLSTSILGNLRANAPLDAAFAVQWESADAYQKRVQMWLVRNNFTVNDGKGSHTYDTLYSELFVDFTGFEGVNGHFDSELQFGQYTGWGQLHPSKRDQVLPWTIEEIQECEFAFRHVSTGSPANYVNVKNAYLVFRGFTVLSLGLDKLNMRYPKPSISGFKIGSGKP